MNEAYDDEADAAYTRDLMAKADRVSERKRLKQLKKTRFFILWNPASNLPPRVQFDSIVAALRVAMPLVRKEKQSIFVLKPVAIAEVTPTPVKVRRIRRER
jgi:hypothetical protein